MTTLIQVAHHRPSNTLEAVVADENGVVVLCQNFSPLQIEDFKLAAGEHAQRYIDLAGWTPEYIAGVKAVEEAEAAEKQDIADAEAAEAEAKRKQAEKEAFDAEVARQVAIMEAAKKMVDAK